MTTSTKPGELRILRNSCEQRPNTAPLTSIPGSAVAASYYKLGNFRQDDAPLDSLTREIGSNDKFLNSNQTVDSIPTRQPGISIAMRPKNDSSHLKFQNIITSADREFEKAPRKLLENGSVSFAAKKDLRSGGGNSFQRKEVNGTNNGGRGSEVFEPLKKKESCQQSATFRKTQTGNDVRNRMASTETSNTVNQTMDDKLATDASYYEPIKLIDSYFKWTDANLKLPSEQTDYIVIGVLGKQGVGKSSLLTALANYGNCSVLKSKGNTESICKNAGGEQAMKRGGVLSHPAMFMKTRARDSMRYDTVGVDIRVTSDRMILLDTQPVLSSSVLDWFNKTDRMPPPDIKYAENWVEMQSLQLASFLLTVCHVVIVMSDSVLDAEMAQFVLLADMLKPAPPVPTDRNGHTIAAEPHVPNLVFVANKSQDGLDQEAQFQAVQMLKETFKSSKISLKGGVDEHSLKMELNLEPKMVRKKSGPKKKVNFCYLPVKKATAPASCTMPCQMFTGNADFKESVRWLKNRIMMLPKTPITVHNTERQWLTHCQKMWDMTRKCQLITEYCQLLT